MRDAFGFGDEHPHRTRKLLMDTDVNIPALYEFNLARAKDDPLVKESLCYITVGTGIGIGLIINGKTVHQKKNNNPTLFDNVSGDFCSYGYAYNCAVGEYRDFKTEFGDCAKGKLVRFLQLSKLR